LFSSAPELIGAGFVHPRTEEQRVHAVVFIQANALKVNAFLRSIIQAFGASRGAVLLSLDPVSGALKARLSPEGPLQQDRFRFSPKIREEDGEYFLSLEGRA
jgi:hypothetical protein